MKKIILILSVNLLISHFGLGQNKNSHSTSISTDSDKPGENTISVMYSEDEHSIEIKQNGNFKISEDETSIVSISENGYISYKKDGKRLKAEKNSEGIIVYKINGAAAKSNLNAEDQKFLTIVIKDLIAHGFGAEDRAERLYKKGGVKSVLNEIESVKGDYARAIYFGHLLKKENLAKTETIETLKQMMNMLSSDYEKAKLLKNVEVKRLQDSEFSQIFYATLKGVSSDYEKSNVIQCIVKKASSASQLTEAIEFMDNISSDYEKSNVLKSIISHQLGDAANFDKLLAAIDVIDSDYEKSGIFKRLMKHNSLNEKQWMDLFTAVKKIDSDYEKSNVLQSALGKMPASEPVKKSFSDCAKTIDSDYEYGRLMKAVQ